MEGRMFRIRTGSSPSMRAHARRVELRAKRLELVEVVRPAAAASLLELLDLIHELLVEGQRDPTAPPFIDHPADHVVDLGRTLAHREIAPGARPHLHLRAGRIGEAIEHRPRLGLLGRVARPHLQRLERAEALELHAGRERGADALADQRHEQRLVAGIAEGVGEGCVADCLGEEQRAVDLLRPEVADDVAGDVRLDRVGEQPLDARQPFADAAVHFADPDVAVAALLDVAGPLPVHIEQGGNGNIWIGEMDGRISERLPRIQRLLAYSVKAHITSNIVGYLWSKQVDCSLLFAHAVGDATFADTFSNARYQPLLVALVGEGVGAALAAGVKLEGFGAFEPLKMRPRNAAEEAEARAVLDRFADSTRSQVKVRSGPWRDLAVRKRPTEVDHMVGWVIGEGRRRGIAMPLNEQLVQQVKELEQGKRSRGLHNLDELEGFARSSTRRAWALIDRERPMRI